ncbi:TetR/AcrR family transcriptional regulator [Sorangium sp. So ce363]|uniref:TetR/AcrR family transcriptional regulator n=1 Tax=Sorangium sp. So ce363 TaxID=3133304 RepID=UPI003F5F16ED
MATKPPRARDAAPDRRVRRTHRQLRTALINLILERGWDAVSVSDVCARADVGRSTFYAHFADKEELLFSGFDELHAALATTREEHAGSFGFVEPMVQHARDNVKLFRAIVGHRSGPGMQRRFRDVFTRLVEAELEALGVAQQERPLIAQYVSGGFLELLMTWLDRPARLDSHALAAVFRRLTEGVLSSVERGSP